MPIPAKPTLTTPPTAPVRGEDRASFAAKANAYVLFIGTNVTDLTAAIDWQDTVFTAVESEAADAAQSAVDAAAEVVLAGDQVALAIAQVALAADEVDLAEAAAAAAVATANAEAWVSGASYDINDNAISQINFKTYRAKSTFTGQTTDPSADETRWVDVIPEPTAILQPSNVSPVDNATDIGSGPVLTGSPYYSLYGLPKSAGQWQVSTDETFATTVIDTGDVAGSSISFTASGLLVSTTYYWRLRYKDSAGVYSEYSDATEFATASAFNNFIATPAATPAAFGDAFEGGFYTGMIWNQVDQSVTSSAIGTGSKSFTTDIDQDTTPLFYSGQTLEIRSRADPDNKMIGTVTTAGGTNLTINVTSVGGSGTFTDWSIMSTYRLIVAPKSSGESGTDLTYKNADTAAPSAAGTLTEGLKATLAMVAAGSSTVYPAAHFCNDLSIGGKTDWYLPARDELELAWRNLKPTTDNNYTIAYRATAATPDYKNLGSYGDTADTHGLNNNSSPTGAAYTAGSPAQTADTAFQVGGAEAFEYGPKRYWSSSEYNGSQGWYQNWNSSSPGIQLDSYKTRNAVVRAIRRSII